MLFGFCVITFYIILFTRNCKILNIPKKACGLDWYPSRAVSGLRADFGDRCIRVRSYDCRKNALFNVLVQKRANKLKRDGKFCSLNKTKPKFMHE